MNTDAAAVAVVGIATFSIWDAWQKAAPTIAELRASADTRTGTDLGVRQKLYDAEITVGSLVAIAGISLAIVSKDARIAALMAGTFLTLVILHHTFLTSDPNGVTT